MWPHLKPFWYPADYSVFQTKGKPKAEPESGARPSKHHHAHKADLELTADDRTETGRSAKAETVAKPDDITDDGSVSDDSSFRPELVCSVWLI